jgi:hypothetical protein
LTRELEAARASELHERERATVVEQKLAAAQSVLSTERLVLEAERVT